MIEQLLTLDAGLRLWLTTHHTPWADVLMTAASVAGQAGSIWILLGAAAVLVRPELAPRLWQLVLAILITYVVIDFVLKPLVARSRPFDVITDVRVVGGRPITYSFPSGHAASAFAGAFIVTLMLPGARHLLWALAALVALSRVYNGVHYPLDIGGGALVGLAVSGMVTGGRACYSRKPSVAPTSVAR